MYESGCLDSRGEPALTWGSINGTLTNQTDLNAALSGKADTSLSNLSNASTARSNLGLERLRLRLLRHLPVVFISTQRQILPAERFRRTARVGNS